MDHPKNKTLFCLICFHSCFQEWIRKWHYLIGNRDHARHPTLADISVLYLSFSTFQPTITCACVSLQKVCHIINNIIIISINILQINTSKVKKNNVTPINNLWIILDSIPISLVPTQNIQTPNIIKLIIEAW